MEDHMSLQLAGWKSAHQVTGDVGKGVNKLLAVSSTARDRHAGAAAALKEFSKKMETVLAAADSAFEAGELDLDGRAIAKAYVLKCIAAAENLSAYHGTREHVETGRVDAYGKVVDVITRHHTVARQQVERLILPVEDAEDRLPRGGRKSAAQRKSEEANQTAVISKDT